MRRRDFISALGGAATWPWPLAVRAQQPPEGMRRLGILSPRPHEQHNVKALTEVLQQLGWREDHNLRVDTRWAPGSAENLRKYAAELVALQPDVILATVTPAVTALQQVSRNVPIVFVGVIDPIGSGLVASLARPGGNATGFLTFE